MIGALAPLKLPHPKRALCVRASDRVYIRHIMWKEIGRYYDSLIFCPFFLGTDVSKTDYKTNILVSASYPIGCMNVCIAIISHSRDCTRILALIPRRPPVRANQSFLFLSHFRVLLFVSVQDTASFIRKACHHKVMVKREHFETI